MNAPLESPRSDLHRPATGQIGRRDKAFARTVTAFFLGGFSTFALLYSVQPLLPLFSRDFALSPAAASFALSISTLVMAPSLLLAGALSETVGRKRMMAFSLVAASLASLGVALAGDWTSLLIFRALTGFALGGLPAVAMAYLADVLAPEALGLVMGIYIAGNTLGGMAGRLIGAVFADHWNWRAGLAAIALISLSGAAYFVYALPRERAGAGKAFDAAALLRVYVGHFRDPGLRLLFAQSFLVIGAFVCTYNYLTFRLSLPPFSLSQTAMGMIFLLYIVGAVSSTVMGGLAGRYGRRRVIWTASLIGLSGVLATLPDNIPLIALGGALITWGFFGAQSIASSWVGLRAPQGRAQATALYLFFFYVGSSVNGSAGGWFYARWGWNGTAAFVGALYVATFVVGALLTRVPPPLNRP